MTADPRTASWLARQLDAAPPVTPAQASVLRSILSPHARTAPARLAGAVNRTANTESQERTITDVPAAR